MAKRKRTKEEEEHFQETQTLKASLVGRSVDLARRFEEVLRAEGFENVRVTNFRVAVSSPAPQPLNQSCRIVTDPKTGKPVVICD